MSTVVRSCISKQNEFYISKHRYLELKHYCLQYQEWAKEYSELSDNVVKSSSLVKSKCSTEIDDLVGDLASRRVFLLSKMELVKQTAKSVDNVLGEYIFIAVTQDKSFVYLKTVLNIPCERDMYYNRYRKFFYLLSLHRV